MMDSDKTLFVICGHYGCGKTNVAVSLALLLKQSRKRVSLIDFDIVNPYFRSADNQALLEAHGVDAVLPPYANSNVDLPTLPAQTAAVFAPDVSAVFDVGGDDAGATALRTLRAPIEQKGYELYCVINARRPAVETPQDAAAMVRDIERAAGLRATGIINNTNLGMETTPQILADSFGYAKETCALLDLPLVATTAFAEICAAIPQRERKACRLTQIMDVTRKIF